MVLINHYKLNHAVSSFHQDFLDHKLQSQQMLLKIVTLDAVRVAGRNALLWSLFNVFDVLRRLRKRIVRISSF